MIRSLAFLAIGNVLLRWYFIVYVKFELLKIGVPYLSKIHCQQAKSVNKLYLNIDKIEDYLSVIENNRLQTCKTHFMVSSRVSSSDHV